MTLDAGSRLGNYEIISLLGRGGMGEVYRARDERLGREVAIKVLPEDVARDAERLQRFEREAQALAQLNDPNVATLHGLESESAAGPGVAPTPFLVMELVEGETLADRIDRGPIPVEEAIPLFLQIARGLEAAHARGIVHRDLKPANVKLAPDPEGGYRVKILDFGLAKASAPAEAVSGDPDLSLSPTLTLAATQRGEILGTAAYMSPEQAKGRPVDRRTDVWAFGACLLEALSGESAFQGEDASEVLGAVLLLEPSWDALPDGTPPLLRRLLRRCLEKNPSRRLHDMGDVRLDLEEVLEAPAEAEAEASALPPPARSSASRFAAAGAAVLAALLAGGAAWLLKPAPEPPPMTRTLLGGSGNPPVRPDSFLTDLAITPDGRAVIYAAGDALWVRPFDQLRGRRLAGSDGASAPFLSPDGEWVGFYDAQSLELKKVSIRGGPAFTIASGGGLVAGATWGEDGTIVFTRGAGGLDLNRVPASGGAPESIDVVVPEGVVDLRWPHFLPGSSSLVLSMIAASGAGQSRLGVLHLGDPAIEPVLSGGSFARYASTGHLVYGLEGTLRAVAFDPETLEVRGNPVPVLEGVVTKGASYSANFDLARNGSLVYVRGADTSVTNDTLAWIDRSGARTEILRDRGAWLYLGLSPDGDRLALQSLQDENDIWIWHFARETLSRLTFSPALEMYPRWTPDGRAVIFGSDRDGMMSLYRRAADGSGVAEPLLLSDGDWLLPAAISPDGRFVVYRSGTDNMDLEVLDLEGEPVGQPLLVSEHNEMNAEISPDGRWIAYQSNESGTAEVYARPFPDVDRGRWQISTGGGVQPLWSADGTTIFYRDGLTQRVVFATPVETAAGGGLRVGIPQRLFESDAKSSLGPNWDVHPDGERFVIVEVGDVDSHGSGGEIVLVQGWLEELERLVAAN